MSWPSTISRSMQPMDQMSTGRPVYRFLSTISGAKKPGEPQKSSSWWRGSQVTASPKSQSWILNGLPFSVTSVCRRCDALAP
eukprot:scaffold1954_cov268-Pinguiococcus_pyrenoidosus.AAC.30